MLVPTIRLQLLAKGSLGHIHSPMEGALKKLENLYLNSLRKFLHHEEALVRMKASHALGMLGTAAKAAAPEIVDVLKHETDHHRRGYVARALGSTGDPASLPALEAALEKETDAGSQGEMRGAIARLKALTAEKSKP